MGQDHADVAELDATTDVDIVAPWSRTASIWSVKTLRNWEQGHASMDPAVQSLLALVKDDPDRAFRVLSGGAAST